MGEQKQQHILIMIIYAVQMSWTSKTKMKTRERWRKLKTDLPPPFSDYILLAN